MHCAGDVSFDPPVDEGFRTNVQGARELLARVREAGGGHPLRAHLDGVRRRPPPRQHPRGAGAAGRRPGGRAGLGLGQRQEIEHRSRGTEVLRRERKKAEKEHSRAGLLTAAKRDRGGPQAVGEGRLVRVGAERARSLGWTDCYTFTKALGERVVEELADRRGADRVSIVRPSIIESGWSAPPGWIEGFKMAEPLILAYGRGELPEFPASPTPRRLRPVDHVVNAIIAVLRDPPEVGQPEYFHVSSGARNPLTFNDCTSRSRLLRPAPLHLG